jgi:hypothetical protein
MRACASVRVHARALLSLRLSLDGFSPKCGYKILLVTTRYMGFLLFVHGLRTRVRSLNFGRFLSNIGGDIQQITRGYMGYLICL